MANLRILAKNLVDDATITADPAVLTTLPATRLQMPTERGYSARTTGLASQDFKLTWGSTQTISMAALTRHNLTKDVATWRNLGYTTADWTGTAAKDTTALVAFSSSGLSSLNDYTSRNFGGMRNAVQYFTTVAGLQSWITRLADASNADGYMEAHKLWLGVPLELQHNPAVGALEMQMMDASVAARADDGSHIVNAKYRARRLTIRLDYIEDDGDLADLLEVAQRLGKTGECWIDVYPDDTGAKGIYHRGAFRLVDSPTFGPVQYGLHRNSLVFEET